MIWLTLFLILYYAKCFKFIKDAQEQQTIDDVLSFQRQEIAEEMENYVYPNSQFGVKAKALEELTPETNGNPMRSLIVATERSGSTFFGEILNGKTT